MSDLIAFTLGVYLTIWAATCFLAPLVNKESRDLSSSGRVLFCGIMLLWPILFVWNVVSPEKKKSSESQPWQ